MRQRVLVLLLCCCAVPAMAQYDAVMSHYFDMEPSFNPAAVGKEDKLNVAVAYNMSLVGYEHNPNTMYAAADVPFYFAKTYHGVGAAFLNDNIGVFSHQRLALQYALRCRLFGGTLAAGVQVGLLMETLKTDSLDLEDSSDPAFASSDQTGNALDIGVGLYYRHKRFYVGLSVEHVNAPLVKLGNTNELKIDATYYFTAGCNISMRNPFLSIKPSVLVRSDFSTWRADLTARLQYTHEKRMMYLGIGYSPTNSVSLFVGGTFHGIVVAYSYEYYTSGISFINGGHEFMVGYQLDINLYKKGRNRHQSVRIL